MHSLVFKKFTSWWTSVVCILQRAGIPKDGPMPGARVISIVSLIMAPARRSPRSALSCIAMLLHKSVGLVREGVSDFAAIFWADLRLE